MGGRGLRPAGETLVSVSTKRRPPPAKDSGTFCSLRHRRRFWGRGYATEAARAALDYAFTVLNKERVISLVHPENQASIRLVERLGQRLQTRIDHFGREMLCFGIDRESWADEMVPAASLVVR